MDEIIVNIIENVDHIDVVVSEIIEEIIISEVFPQGPIGPQGPGGANVEQIIVAKEFIPAYSVITDTGYIADSNNVTHRNIILGMTFSDIQSGHEGVVVMIGRVVNPLWNWTAGDIFYLNGANISKTSPTTGFRVRVGQAAAQTTLMIDITESILF